MNVLSARLLALCVLFIVSHPGQSGELADIRLSETFEVSPEIAWKTWTTVEGLQSFLAPRAEVEAAGSSGRATVIGPRGRCWQARKPPRSIWAGRRPCRAALETSPSRQVMRQVRQLPLRQEKGTAAPARSRASSSVSCGPTS